MSKTGSVFWALEAHTARVEGSTRVEIIRLLLVRIYEHSRFFLVHVEVRVLGLLVATASDVASEVVISKLLAFTITLALIPNHIVLGLVLLNNWSRRNHWKLICTLIIGLWVLVSALLPVVLEHSCSFVFFEGNSEISWRHYIVILSFPRLRSSKICLAFHKSIPSVGVDLARLIQLIGWLIFIVLAIDYWKPVLTSLLWLEGGRVVLAIRWLHLRVVSKAGSLNAKGEIRVRKIVRIFVQIRYLVAS